MIDSDEHVNLIALCMFSWVYMDSMIIEVKNITSNPMRLTAMAMAEGEGFVY